MLSVVHYLGIVAFLMILFGPYRIHISSNNNEDRCCWVMTVSAWRQLYGFRWIFTHDDRLFIMLLFNRRIFSIRKEVHVPESAKTAGQKKSRRKNARITCLIRNGISRLPAWLGVIRKNFRLQKMEGVCEYGFADPAVTGIVYGWFFALKSCYPEIDLEIRPQFNQSRFQGEFLIIIKTILIVVLFNSLRLGIEGYRIYRICRV